MSDVKEHETKVQQDAPETVKHRDNRVENMIKLYEIYSKKATETGLSAADQQMWSAKAAEYLAMIEQLSPWEELYRKNFKKVSEIHKHYVTIMNSAGDQRARITPENTAKRLKWLELASRFGNNISDIAEKLTNYQYSRKLEDEYKDLGDFIGL